MESNYKNGPTGHKNMILTVVSIFSYSTIKFKNLVCKVSVSALYYLPIPIFTYTLVYVKL